MEPAQRRAYPAGTALATAVLGTVLAVVGLSACSGSDSGGGPALGASGVSGQATTVQPGKYRTLPDACGAIGADTLRTLLPARKATDGAGEDSQDADEGQTKLYEGRPDVTYDADRRVGCRWTVETDTGTRHLALDFERVVSYDPAVSDDDRAISVYEKKAKAAHVPEGPGTGAGSGSPTTPTSSGSASSHTSAPPTKGGENASSTPTGENTDDTDENTGDATDDATGDGETPDLAVPRRLEDLGDAAYLDDHLGGGSAPQRKITVVFRSSNVIATISYDETSPDETRVPSSEELQGNAEDLARELTGTLNE